MTRLRHLLVRLAVNESGLWLTEFALVLPVIMLLGFGGIETSHYVLAHLRVAQIAETVADNAGRIRNAVKEDDIDAIMVGAKMMGDSIGFAANGRIILSDLEMRTNTTGAGGVGTKTTDNPNGYRQWIRWQRCAGALNVQSSYGVPIDANGAAVTNLDAAGDDHGADQVMSTIDGIGPVGQQIAATSGTAVMFVEVVYTYQPFLPSFAMGPQTFRVVQAFNIRQRTQYSIYNSSNLSGTNRSDCQLYNAAVPTG